MKKCILNCLVLALLLLVATEPSAHAETSEKLEAVVAEDLQTAPLAVVTLDKATPDQISNLVTQKFYRAISQVYQSNFAAAAIEFSAIRDFGEKREFANFPEFSHELIRSAEVAGTKGKAATIQFFLAQAAELSPTHPRIQFELSHQYKYIGLTKALGHISTALRYSVDYPGVMFSILIQVFFFSLIGITLGLLIAVLIQLVRNSEMILARIARPFPRPYRNIFALLLFPILLVFPLKAGLLGAMACWAVLLTIFKAECKYLGVACGVLFIAWGIGLPVIQQFSASLGDPQMHALEELNNASFAPNSESLMFDTMLPTAHEPIVKLIAAQSLYRLGDEEAAVGIYENLYQMAGAERDVLRVAALNLAALRYKNRRLHEAVTILSALENAGEESFELFYDLHLVHLALLDTAKRREYFNRARDYDSFKTNNLVLNAADEATILTQSAASSTLYRRLINQLQGLRLAVSPEASRIVAVMLPQANIQKLVLIGLGLLISSALLSLRWTARRRRKTICFTRLIQAHSDALYWRLMPAGSQLVGDKPLQGGIVIGLILASLFAALNAPVPGFALLGESGGVSIGLLVFFVLLFLSGLLYSCLDSRQKGEEI